MNLGAEVVLAVAERVERAGGPRAGLAAYKRVADGAGSSEVRARACLAALRCAAALADLAALAELTAIWERVDAGMWEEPITKLVVDLAKSGIAAQATALARAEVRRNGTARALYLHARCLDTAGERAAPEAFALAIARALKEGSKEVEVASRVRRASWLARSYDTLADALAEAQRVDLALARPEDKLAIAEILLFSPSRFTRAGAIGLLDDLVCGGGAGVAARALVVVARLADDASDGMTPLELDRLLAVLARDAVVKAAPRARDAVRAIRAMAAASSTDELDAALAAAAAVDASLAPLFARARSIAGGRYEPYYGAREARSATQPLAWQIMLDAAVALRDGSPARAAASLRDLAELSARGERVPRQALALAARALVHEDAELRDVAAALVRARLARPAPGGPPGGWLPLARALSTSPSELAAELAPTALRAAALAKEPGAGDELVVTLTRSAWERAARGEKDEAIAMLREAESMASTRS